MDSGYDKARKPYVPIDTCSPRGTWVEERRYNRRRLSVTAAAAADTADGASSSPTAERLTAADRRPRRVLCGNWQEDDALERDLLAIQEAQRQQQQQPSHPDGSPLATSSAPVRRIQSHLATGWCPTATMEVITQKANGLYTGGHTSTPYLTCDSRHPGLRDLDSTYRVDFNSASSDVASQRRPGLGVRSQRLMEQARVAAQETQASHAAARQAQEKLREMSNKTASRSWGPNISEYFATLCDQDEVLPVVESLTQDYLSDEPITLYTGNPTTGSLMTVHGKTPADPTSATQFGKHTHFSEFKYAY